MKCIQHRPGLKFSKCTFGKIAITTTTSPIIIIIIIIIIDESKIYVNKQATVQTNYYNKRENI